MARRTPRSTYRLQIRESFDLHAATGVLPYLRDLGVDWVYLSPLLAAEAGSDHGYDVADHSRIDPARGGPEGLARLSRTARSLGMGVLVDIVPNHVGVADPAGNPWWWSLLEHGQGSPYAEAFDVDWAAGRGRLRIPVVGDDDQRAPGGPIAHLTVVDGELRYHDHRFPLAPGTEGDDPQAVHAAQHYELVNWRLADTGLNYRRFFAVNTLAAVRVEEPEWFAASHAEIGRWFEGPDAGSDDAGDSGPLVDGLRVDHPDGLRFPGRYLADLADLTGGAYVLVEKILEGGERLPASWATAGTTGYDAMALVDRVLVDPAGQELLDALETRLRGARVEWEPLIHRTKRAVADGILNSEVRRITRELTGGEEPPTTVDAVAELLACFPVYRSYLPTDGAEHLAEAIDLARSLRPDLVGEIERVGGVLADAEHPAALRFQQTSGMVMAKGVEDCAFYRWSRLTSLNEVGGDPALFAVSPQGFHDAMALRQREWPTAMSAGSTHDTKRGEDVRARISVLAEIPEVWEATLDRLLTLAPLPDPGFGALLWQAILGAWPASRERLHGYAEKAMREAGDHTLWTAPDADYEAAVHAAVDAAFDDERVRALLDDLLARIAGPGWVNSLSAKAITLTMPGVPDVYHGSELWEQSLVDPDNRRAVDFAHRRSLLDLVSAGELPALGDAADDDGAAKLRLVATALRLRRDRPDLFTTYAGLGAEGSQSEHVLAFDRGGAVTVATRLPVGLGEWAPGTTLALPGAGPWRDLISERVVGTDAEGRAEVSDLLATYPVALLMEDS